MKHTKKKSSGWQPPDERGTWQERHARQADAQIAKARRDCDALRLWHCCPARRCLRARGCTGQPRDCLDRHRLPQNTDAAPRPQPTARAAAETASSRHPSLRGRRPAPRRRRRKRPETAGLHRRQPRARAGAVRIRGRSCDRGVNRRNAAGAAPRRGDRCAHTRQGGKVIQSSNGNPTYCSASEAWACSEACR